MRRRCRLLVALAYELVWPLSNRRGPICYEVVSLPPDTEADPRAEAVHGISVAASCTRGRPVAAVLCALFHCLDVYQPRAVVGHDVVGDVHLLVSEAVRCGCVSGRLPAALSRLVCTRMLATHRCAIPRPGPPAPPLRRRPGAAAAARRPGFKWPSLRETYRLLVRDGGVPPVHPDHDARGDVERCREVFLSILHQTRPPASAAGPPSSGGCSA